MSGSTERRAPSLRLLPMGDSALLLENRLGVFPEGRNRAHRRLLAIQRDRRDESTQRAHG